MTQIKVLHVVHEMAVGGIQSFLMNLMRNIDRSYIQFDFLLSVKSIGTYEKEIIELGGHIYRVTGRRESVIRNRKEVEQFFKEHNDYQCVHCHWSNLSYIEPIICAKKYGIPVRIIHSHSTNAPKNPIHRVLHEINRKRIANYATDFFSCSDLAGKWLFGGTNKDFVIVNNGIEVDKYTFAPSVRAEYRKKLGIEDSIVFGSVGRYCEAKNHEFLISLFSEIQKNNCRSVLLLVGVSPQQTEINEMICRNGIQDSVRILGTRSDISELLQCMDCFLMPSKWEGFPVSLLEAQAAGLPCYVSDTVTKQAQINNNVIYLKLSSGYTEWATQIINDFEKWQRIDDNRKIKIAGYDISDTINFLVQRYVRG